jgi:asparagine synthetase B (glutamine-hydrolysing)
LILAKPRHNPCTLYRHPRKDGQKETIILLFHNGEIYNYIEIRTHLEKEGYSFHTQSDTEVILAAYDFWNDECIEHFDGMFAFAIWDEKEQELFAARDRFGEKPFFIISIRSNLFLVRK